MKPKDTASSSFDCFNIDQKERDALIRSAAVTTGEPTLYPALELRKNSCLLAIQIPGRGNPSLHPIKGSDADGLLAKLDAACERLAKSVGQVPAARLCYEAGYNGFWLARRLARSAPYPRRRDGVGPHHRAYFGNEAHLPHSGGLCPRRARAGSTRLGSFMRHRGRDQSGL